MGFPAALGALGGAAGGGGGGGLNAPKKTGEIANLLYGPIGGAISIFGAKKSAFDEELEERRKLLEQRRFRGEFGLTSEQVTQARRQLVDPIAARSAQGINQQQAFQAATAGQVGGDFQSRLREEASRRTGQETLQAQAMIAQADLDLATQQLADAEQEIFNIQFFEEQRRQERKAQREQGFAQLMFASGEQAGAAPGTFQAAGPGGTPAAGASDQALNSRLDEMGQVDGVDQELLAEARASADQQEMQRVLAMLSQTGG
ncbi:MAG: hypothetical protein GY788_21110 [bacterium]|nr:hypothetical protein [bacterium]